MPASLVFVTLLTILPFISAAGVCDCSYTPPDGYTSAGKPCHNVFPAGKCAGNGTGDIAYAGVRLNDTYLCIRDYNASNQYCNLWNVIQYKFKPAGHYTGQCRFGFSHSGGMEAADMAIIWVDMNGQGQISGRLGPQRGNGYPPVNPAQYNKLISANKNGTHLMATFSRPLNPCTSGSIAITDETMKIITAFSNVVPQDDENIAQHGDDDHGIQNVHMLSPEKQSDFDRLTTSPGVDHYDIRWNPVTLPTDTETYYYCQILPMPKRPIEYVVATEMNLDPITKPYVHHLLVYACDSDLSDLVGQGSNCFAQGNDKMLSSCDKMLGGWAVGGDPFMYPPNMSRKIFEPTVGFVRVEVHYNNPQMNSSIVDQNSFFRYYMVRNPRPINVGSFFIMAPPSPVAQLIPPQMQAFTSYVYCPGQCTGTMPRPVTIFTAMLHSHLLGIRMVIRHIRNGVEMPPIVRDDHYDFNYQDETLLNQPVQILPGDDMVLECTYDSSQRNNATVGGWGTPEEMCMVFMEYYPKMDGMTDMSCMSFTDPRALLMLLGIQNRTIGNDLKQAIDNGTVPSVTFRGQTMPVTDFYNTQVQWTPQLKASLQNFAKNSKQTVMCEMNAQAAYNEDNDNGQSGTNADSAINVSGGIKITQPYMPPNVCAMQRGG